MIYELIICPNWGISRAEKIYCRTEEELMNKYRSTALGGKGNVCDVIARINGKVVKAKHLKTDL